MLSQFFPPVIGGEETYVQTLSRALVERGHQVAVATLWNEGLAKFEEIEGVRIHRISGTMQRANFLFKEAERKHVPPFSDPELIGAIRRVMRLERPQIVHSHNWLGRSFLPLKPFGRVKFVVSLHDYSLVCAKKSLLYQDSTCSGPGLVKCLGCAVAHYGKAKGTVTTLANFAMAAGEKALADMYLPVSQATAAGNGLTDGQRFYQVVPNFLPERPDSFQEEGQAQAFEEYLEQLPAEPFLLYVGDLRRFKGLNVLLEAYERLDRAGTGLPPLVLIGRLCEDTPERFPRKVFHLGRWPHEAVLAAWQRSLFGLLPSIGPETFGIAALEAMAMGRPVIVARSGGLGEVVKDGVTGLVVPPGDVTALAEAIQYLLDHPAIRDQMGRAAADHANHFRSGAVVPQIEQIYYRLLSTRQRRPAVSEAN